MDADLQQQAEALAQEQEQQADNPPPAEPQSLEQAMFGDEGADDAPDAPAEVDTPAGDADPDAGGDEPPAEPAPEKVADDLTAPEGLSEKASARFQALANQVKEYRARDEEYRVMSETVQEFQRLAQESCNNSEEVLQLFDYAKAVKTGDFDQVEHYLRQQVAQFEALSGRRIAVDLAAEYPDLQQKITEFGMDADMAHEVAAARWQQKQQQQYLQQQRAAQEALLQQQQAAQQAEAERQAVFDKAVQDVNQMSAELAKTDVLWPELEPKVIEFARSQLANVPPESWVPVLRSFYDGLKKAVPPVRQAVPPLRGGGSAGGRAEPQSLEEAMFGGL